MKLSVKQANLLATKVREKLQEDSKFIVTPAKRKEIQKWIAEQQKLMKIHNTAEKAKRDHYNTFGKITGLDSYYKPYEEKLIVAKIAEKAIPSLQMIENEIILSSMFTEDQDLEAFINGIVKKFTTKKIPVK